MQNAWIRRSRIESSLDGDVFLVAFAERTVAAEIAVFVVKTRIVEAPFLFEVQQFATLLFVQILRLPDLFGEQQNPADRETGNLSYGKEWTK